ncbi:uncharacterized protein LOC109542025 [Dendroctonus ponderosae]|uniref:Uncharacterized protein n=1 Tax=Dendroctonus ponderosae TaxID=77166 RepID=A0AAR5Q0J5_DENPD|nr:uncharacterized protein LOC109542025 [Dendroctonus ponderosae]
MRRHSESDFFRSRMLHVKSVLLVLLVVACASCYGQGGMDRYPGYNGGYKKKHHHHHHGMHYLHFLTYLSFLAVKLKIIFFIGTIFTVSLVAAKVIGIIKLTEYMKHKYPEHHHEEKIVYVNPHEHDHHDFGGYSGGPSDIYSSKSYSSYPPDFSADQPPEGAYDHERFAGPAPYENVKPSARNLHGGGVLEPFRAIAAQLRQLNITDMALKEMGIKDETCKKKFVCQADFNAQQSAMLRTGLDIMGDVSYQRLRPNITITSIEQCQALYPECAKNPG